MEQVPTWTDVSFLSVTLLATVLFLRATGGKRWLVIALSSWAFILAAIALCGFFLETSGTPPRFIVVPVVPLLFIAWSFFTHHGRNLLNSIPSARLTLIHLVRIPVELLLLSLYLHGAVPQVMTFLGGNLDILSGLSAGLIYWLDHVRGSLPRWSRIVWEIVCLGLLIHIVFNAILSVPFAFQRYGFEQPNIAVLHFPYIWLPGLIVPMVLFAHLVQLRRLLFLPKTPSSEHLTLHQP